MRAGALPDAGASTTEVRVYRDHRLVVREICESAEEAGAIIEQTSELDHVYLIVADESPDHGPGDVIARRQPVRVGDDDEPLASRQLSGCGTE